jgi:hypothetical protein
MICRFPDSPRDFTAHPHGIRTAGVEHPASQVSAAQTGRLGTASVRAALSQSQRSNMIRWKYRGLPSDPRMKLPTHPRLYAGAVWCHRCGPDWIFILGTFGHGVGRFGGTPSVTLRQCAARTRESLMVDSVGLSKSISKAQVNQHCFTASGMSNTVWSSLKDRRSAARPRPSSSTSRGLSAWTLRGHLSFHPPTAVNLSCRPFFRRA